MELATIAAQQPSPRPVVSRGPGLAIASSAAGVAALLAAPASSSDYDHPGVQTVYPLMLPPLIAIMAAAGIAAACIPAAARAGAVIGGITALQVAGIAVVACRDWYSFAGADGASMGRAFTGSLLSLAIAAVASGVVVTSLVLYRSGTGPGTRRSPVARAGSVIAGTAVVVAVPMVLCEVLHRPEPTAFGQFALWWSLPWGLGIVAAGALRTPAARRAAVLSVAVSVLLARVCVTAPVLYGFDVRLPD